MNALEAWMRSRLPLDPRVLKQALTEAGRRGVELGLDGDAMTCRLETDADERDRLLEQVVPPESWLFRHGAAFETLRAWLAERPPTMVRMASLGCAHGAEAYSMAITAASLGRTATDTRVLAVDWNARHLQRAMAGHCSPLAQRGPLPAWSLNFLTPDAEGWLRLRPEPLAMIEWMHGDLLTRVLPGPFDVVFCRNVAIYLDHAARSRLAERLADLVVPEGLLFLGHADPSALWEDGFRPSEARGAFAFQRRSRANHSTLPPALPVERVRSAERRLQQPAPVTHGTPHPPLRADDLATAQALADAGRLQEAGEQVQALLSRQPMSASAWALMGSIHLAQARTSEAEACFRKSVYLRPDALALLQWSALAEARGDAEAARTLRARAARTFTEEAA